MNDVALLLPVAGRSSRYAGMRPKWLLTHPSGNFMLTEAIRGLSPSKFKEIVVVALRAHEREYDFAENLRAEMAAAYGIGEDRVRVVLLKSETASQPETVARGLKKAEIEGKVLIKDSDNYFRLESEFSGNAVAVGDLGSVGAVEAANKSYVGLGADGVIENIVEKRAISNLFCAGGYFFHSAVEFQKYYELLSEDRGIYVSHVIQRMLDDGHRFVADPCEGFQDWGTLADWRRYQQKFATLFLNLDGILVFDSSRNFDPKWGTTEALRRNVAAVNQLHDSGRVHIAVLTSRPESFRKETEAQLRKHGIQFHRIIMGLPYGCRQTVVNVFSKDTVYEAASAINTRTNDDRLDEMLASLLAENPAADT